MEPQKDNRPLKLGDRLATGAIWMVLMRFSMRGIGFISTIILARLLVPDDFGIVALATMFATLLDVMSDFNFAVYLIREQKADRKEYDTAWTLQAIRGFIIAGILVACAGLAADFFEKEELITILYCLAGATIVEGFVNIGIVDFRKSLNFRREFRFMVSVKVTSFVVTVVLAFLLRSYWALVAGILSGRVARLVLSYWLHPFRPRLALSRWRRIMGFSKWLVANQMLAFVINRADVFVIGKLAGTTPLGVYTIGNEVARIATSELVMPIHRVLLPGYAKVAEDPKALRSGYLSALSLIVMLGVPVAAGVALLAGPLVKILFGEKWLDAIPLIQVLAIAGVASVFRSNAHPMLLAMGLPHLTTVISSVMAATLVPLLIWWTSLYGAVGAAWAVSTATLVGVFTNFVIVVRGAKLSPVRIFTGIWRSLVSVIVMFAVVRSVLGSLPEVAYPDLLALVAGTLSGALSYTLLHWLLWRATGSPAGPEQKILELARTRFGRRPAPAP